MEFLDVSGLTKRYGGIVALSGANFSARRGEVHALLGENGAGKSTLIQILAGAVRHDSGAITVNDRPFRPSNPDAAAAAGISAVFQELSQIPDLTVEQNIWFRRENLSLLGTVRRTKMRTKTQALFEKYRFPPLAPDRTVRRLTLAERQIVEIAKGLAADPSVLIFDEATSALPAREAEWLLGLTRQLADENRVVIFISHRMAEVRHIADRLTIFRNGATVAVHDTQSISDDDIVSQMLGRKLSRLYPERLSTATGKIALRVHDFSVGKRVRDVGFDLREGEVLGVGGLQGHGQRELFQGLFGASRSRGRLELWGKPASISNPREALIGRDGLALVPEDRRGQGILLSKSVRENLTVSVIRRFSKFGLLDRRKEQDLVAEMVDFLRIKTRTPEQPAGTLSGGNQQKVIFGKMLLTQARILLLYDPTRGVDVGTKGEIFQLMRDLAAKGYAILFYSSDLPELVHVADRVLVMRNGELAATLEGSANSEEGILRA
ncbi:MAG: sugar ABC transporter ATP-binding protein, partial [Rhizobiaceae bacterium]|nr:sugar ABC transporter ATP-binding protein [Rhizobiaceae bacterium]